MRYLLLLGFVAMLLVKLPALVYAQDASILQNYEDCDFVSGDESAGLHIGAVVLDFETRLGCVQNYDRVFNSASVPKIFVAAAYYDGVINRTINNAGQLQFTRNYWMNGSSDCLTESDIGTSFTYEQLVTLMISCSDNAATWILMDSIGWQRINDYVQSLGIEGIGTIIPYSEVDRLKLAFLDERWTDVPAGIASRFYRSGVTQELSSYFDSIPQRPNRQQFIEINERYFTEYDYNTLTPRALAAFVMRMRDHLLNGEPEQWYVANNLFRVMTETQRLFSAQALPGDVYVASKNGFDRGVLAEANVLLNDLDTLVPSGIVLLFAQFETLSGGAYNAQLPNRAGDRLNDFFFEVSTDIREWLFPNYRQPAVMNNAVVSTIIVNDQPSIQSCWAPYFQSGFDPTELPAVTSCYNRIRPRITYPVGQNVALGMVLSNMGFSETRFTFVFTAPDNRQFSYQLARRNVDSSAVYWFHPLDLPGQWQIDIYVNLQHAYSEAILAQR